MVRKIIRMNFVCLFLFFLLTLAFGCSAMHNRERAAFNKLYNSGNYMKVAAIELQKKGDKKSDPSNLLHSMQAGTALRYSKQYNESSSVFDECEEIIKYHNEKMMAQNVLSNAGAVMVNDSVLDYTGTEYDGIMVNTYKALNFWQLGQNDLARIEFNRALERQRRAKERFATKIQQQKEKIAKKQEEEKEKAKNQKAPLPTLDINKNLNNPEIAKILNDKYSNLYEFKAYPDFINPFTTYMASLFFMSQRDYKKSIDLLKETYGMVDKNPIVADDFASMEKRLSGKKINDDFVWIVFENGIGPEKEEFRIDLPLFIFSNNVKYTGIALPKLKFRNQAYPFLTVKNDEKDLCKTCELASMDRVVQTEFKNEYNMILTRAIMCTLTKTCAQYMANRKFGQLGGWAAACYQAATTAADLRIWTALPKDFQIAKVTTPDNGQLTLSTPSGKDINVQVPQNSSSLIYLKIPTQGAKVAFDVIAF